MKYHKVAVGGTFDYFHDGHRALLKRAFEIGERVVVGITSDNFVHIGHMSHIRPIRLISYPARKRAVEVYITQHNWQNRCEIIELSDSFGPTITDPEFDMIVVSPETEKVAHEINEKRAVKGFKPLVITLVPWVLAEDRKPIHSTRIRNGEIDTDGTVFSIPENWGVKTITPELRLQLQQPFGKLHTNFMSLMSHIRPMSLISVGDKVTRNLLQAGIVPHIAIIDYHIQRKRVYSHFSELGFSSDVHVESVVNPAGTLSYTLFAIVLRTIAKAYMSYESYKTYKTHVILVDGEEDLTVLLAVLAAPLGALILYGQPHEGVVMIDVSLEYKRKAIAFLNQFEK